MSDPKPWHEQDDFWDRVSPVLFDTRRLADPPADVDNIIALLQSAKPSCRQDGREELQNDGQGVCGE